MYTLKRHTFSNRRPLVKALVTFVATLVMALVVGCSDQDPLTPQSTNVKRMIPATNLAYIASSSLQVTELQPNVVQVGPVTLTAAVPDSDFNLFQFNCDTITTSSVSRTDPELRRELVGTIPVMAMCGFSENGNNFYFRYEWCVGSTPVKVEWALDTGPVYGVEHHVARTCRDIDRIGSPFVIAKSLIPSVVEEY